MLSTEKEEFNAWKSYINTILNHDVKNDVKIYVKGGAVLGLQCLKLDESNAIAENFSGLIKDWDFVLITSNFYLHEDMTMEGETIKVMRYKTPSKRMMIGKDAFFEMSIRNENYKLSELELPLTSMKIEITTDNLDSLFILIESIYLNKPDLSLLNHIDIIIDDYDSNGLFSVTNIDDGGLSNDFISLLGDNLNVRQFFISHMKEPDRLFYRLFEKNLPKALKIREKCKIDWLPNVNYINNIFDTFVNELNKHINMIYNKYYNDMKNEYDMIQETELNVTIYECKQRILELYDKNLNLNICIDELNNYIRQKYNLENWVYNNMKDLPEIIGMPNNTPNNTSKVLMILSPIKTLNLMQLPSLAKKIDEFTGYLTNSIIYENELQLIPNDMKWIKEQMSMEKKKRNKHIMLIRVRYRKLFNELNLLFTNINLGRMKEIIEKYDLTMIDRLKFIFSSILESKVIDIGLMDTKLYDGYRIHEFLKVLK